MIYVDADACPVKDEVVRVAARNGVAVLMVSGGGIRPSAFPTAQVVVVPQGPDAADQWIAERATTGDICITADIPLAARCVQAGAQVLRPNGQPLDAVNIGPQLAQRDLAADLRAADPWRQGSGRSFEKGDRTRFLNALERAIRQAADARRRGPGIASSPTE